MIKGEVRKKYEIFFMGRGCIWSRKAFSMVKTLCEKVSIGIGNLGYENIALPMYMIMVVSYRTSGVSTLAVPQVITSEDY